MPANVSIGGTWLFNETINWPYEFDRNYDAAFSTESPNISYIEFNIIYYNLTDEPYFTLAFFYYLFEGVSLVVYDSRTGWVDEGYRAITFYDGETMSPEGYEWLTANATPFTPSITAPVIDPLSLFMGWKAGNWVARQRGRKAEEEKTPVAFLYNGVPLPDINAVWTDKETYPYSLIYLKDGFACLYLLTSEIFVNENNEVEVKNYGRVAISVMLSIGSGWSDINEIPIVDAYAGQIFCSVADFVYFIWTSHDILNADGTVFLATSDPVPVYE